MARINTKTLLTEYIKSMLGAPLITIEVNDMQISQIIDDAVQKFTEYSWADLEDYAVLDFNGKGDYNLPANITNIIALSGSESNVFNFDANFGKGYVPDMWSAHHFRNSGSMMGGMLESVLQVSATKSIIDKYFNIPVAYDWNYLKKIMSVTENYVGKLILHYNYEYQADSVDDIYNHEWIKAYCIEKTKFLWGSVVGKYSQSLVGGATINYSEIKSEAEQGIEKLDELLLTKWSDPCPISVC